MKTANKHRLTRLSIGGIMIVAICCLLPAAYMTIREVDREICYRRIANELNVAPNYEAISSALFAQVESVLSPGMERYQVIAALEQIAPVATHKEGPTLNGGFEELVMLKICTFSTSDVLLLIFYSHEGKLEEVRLYFND